MNENEKLEAILREIVDELATRYDSHLCGSMAKWAAEEAERSREVSGDE